MQQPVSPCDTDRGWCRVGWREEGGAGGAKERDGRGRAGLEEDACSCSGTGRGLLPTACT